MNTPVRQPLWCGHQAVAALWFDATLLPAPRREALLLAQWQPGARALRFAGGDLLVFAQPQWRNCGHGHGLPLRRIDGLLLSAPLRADEREGLGGADIGLVAAAGVQPLQLADAAALDLSHHIDLGGYALHETFDLRPAPGTAPPLLVPRDLRELLGDKMPRPSADARRFVERLQQQGGATRPASPLQRLWRGLLGGAAAATRSAAHGGNGNGRVMGSGVGARRQAPAPARWRNWLASLANLTGAAALLGWSQGRYLRRLFHLFENNDLDEALRHALPLGGSALESLGQAFGTPGRRQQLDLSSAGAARASINLPEQLREQLRRLYRAAFERLDRAGRIDEAVFVLAQLLEARTEALDYLLLHGRGSQAAQLALAWDMPPAVIIRILLLAGDTQRALQVARRDQAFAEAVALLQVTHAQLADQLRAEWGRSLVARGEWLAAVDAVWPVPALRADAAQWLRTAEAAGAEFGARALVRRAVLLPDSLAEQTARIEALADAAAPASSRTALARELLAADVQNPALAAMTALLLPLVAADRAQNHNDLNGHELDKLVRRADDPALGADLPRWLLPPRAAARPLLKHSGAPLRIASPAAGLHAIHDAGVLTPGRYLLALGEAGAVVCDGAGQVLQRYAVPAHDLVMSDNSRVALAVARREGSLRVSRLDLVTQRISDLGGLTPQRFNRWFNGLSWTVVGQREIRRLDTSPGGELATVWRVETPGLIGMASFDRDSDSHLVQSADGDAFELWSYVGLQRRLQARTPVTPDPRQQPLLLVTGLWQTAIVSGSDGAPLLRYEQPGSGGTTEVLSVALPELAQAVHCSSLLLHGAVLACVETESAQHFRLLRLGSTAPLIAALDWPGGGARVVERGQQLIFFDARGRVLQLDLETSRTHAFSLA